MARAICIQKSGSPIGLHLCDPPLSFREVRIDLESSHESSCSRPTTVVSAQSLQPEAGLQASGQWHVTDRGERREIEPVDVETVASDKQDREE
jgi:hypothetical protein